MTLLPENANSSAPKSGDYLEDSAQATDSIYRTVDYNRQQNEGVSAIETLRMSFQQVSSDTVGPVTDVAVFNMGKYVQDGIGTSETKIYTMSKVDDFCVHADDDVVGTLNKLYGGLKDLTSFSDSFVYTLDVVIGDVNIPIDTISYSLDTSLADNSTVSDSLVFDMDKVVGDATSITDLLLYTLEETLRPINGKAINLITIN